jgi:predicted phage terminase large subunit-like protein
MQDKIIYHINKWKPEKIGIEAFQAQSMIVTFLKNEMHKRGIYADIEEIRQTGDKLSKIRSLIPYYRRGLIYHTLQMQELEQEQKRFPRGKHDDIVDAQQMLYHLYELQPNSFKSNIDIKMEWDSM